MLESELLSTTSRQSLPKALQVTEMLVREIASGRLADGERLPPERRMAADLNIAVGTLRRALANLEEQGLLKRVQGSGNYVCAQKDIKSIYAFFRLERLQGGGLPSAEIVDVLRLLKPGDMPFIGSGRYAHRIRRTRYLNEMPVALEEIWLDSRFTDRLKKSDLSESLYLYYKTELGLIISGIEDKVSVSRLPGWGDLSLKIEPGDTCGYVERIGFSQDGTQAEYSRTWFDQTVAQYTVRQ
ncbi:MAG: GntR family transcriptional regulator [Pseudomonadota bacterium]